MPYTAFLAHSKYQWQILALINKKFCIDIACIMKNTSSGHLRKHPILSHHFGAWAIIPLPYFSLVPQNMSTLPSIHTSATRAVCWKTEPELISLDPAESVFKGVIPTLLPFSCSNNTAMWLELVCTKMCTTQTQLFNRAWLQHETPLQKGFFHK